MPPPGQAPSQPPSRVGGPPALCRFKLQGESRMDDPLRHGGGSTQLGESSKCSSHASRQFWLGRAVESGPTGGRGAGRSLGRPSDRTSDRTSDRGSLRRKSGRGLLAVSYWPFLTQYIAGEHVWRCVGKLGMRCMSLRRCSCHGGGETATGRSLATEAVFGRFSHARGGPPHTQTDTDQRPVLALHVAR